MSSTIDLSDFTVSISYMDEMVRYFDETDNQDKEARECEVTWTHNTLSLTPKKYYLRENHVYWESNIAGRQIEILEEWLEELGHDPKKYDLDRELRLKDLKIKHPYNTYHIKGLPPSPISYVGSKTIELIFENYKSKYLYYFYNNVVKKHIYSETYIDHKRKLSEYRNQK